MIRPAWWIAMLAVPMTACGNGVAPIAAKSDREQAATVNAAVALPTGPGNGIAPWDASSCGDDAYQNAKMQRHPALMDRSPEEIAAAYGTPASGERFKVGEPVGTFYGALGRRQPVSPDAGLPAQQLTWTRNGCNFTVFFVERARRWRAVEAYEWAVGADF